MSAHFSIYDLRAGNNTQVAVLAMCDLIKLYAYFVIEYLYCVP